MSVAGGESGEEVLVGSVQSSSSLSVLNVGALGIDELQNERARIQALIFSKEIELRQLEQSN